MTKRILEVSATVLLIVALVFAGGVHLHHRTVNARLVAALNQDNVKAVEAALQQGANLHMRGGNGEAPLMVAAAHGGPELVRQLIEKGADVNAVSDDGCTALIAAAITGNAETATVLIAAGADVNARQYQHSALSVSRDYGHRNVARVLKAAGAR